MCTYIYINIYICVYIYICICCPVILSILGFQIAPRQVLNFQWNLSQLADSTLFFQPPSSVWVKVGLVLTANLGIWASTMAKKNNDKNPPTISDMKHQNCWVPSVSGILWISWLHFIPNDTVHGRNPAPPNMYETLWIMGYLPYQQVSLPDFWTINPVSPLLPLCLPPIFHPNSKVWTRISRRGRFGSAIRAQVFTALLVQRIVHQELDLRIRPG